MAPEISGSVGLLGQYYIFGNPVNMSPSPEIHGVGFDDSGRSYGRFQSSDVEEVLREVRSDRCVGGSVTIPLKESLLSHMDSTSAAASSIGALNTITKNADGKLHGDNTDWIGIKMQIEHSLSTRGLMADELVCLLCGAGGTARAAAYALRSMGVKKVHILNRNQERASQLAENFGYKACSDVAPLISGGRLDIVLCTLPGNVGFVFPDTDFLLRCKPLVFEAAYIPRRTALVSQALAAGCEVIEGIDFLFEQGCAQCEIWTGSAAPRAKIARNLLDQLFGEKSCHPARGHMQPLTVPPVGLVRNAELKNNN